MTGLPTPYHIGLVSLDSFAIVSIASLNSASESFAAGNTFPSGVRSIGITRNGRRLLSLCHQFSVCRCWAMEALDTTPPRTEHGRVT